MPASASKRTSFQDDCGVSGRFDPRNTTRHFLTLLDFSGEEIVRLLELSSELKADRLEANHYSFCSFLGDLLTQCRGDLDTPRLG